MLIDSTKSSMQEGKLLKLGIQSISDDAPDFLEHFVVIFPIKVYIMYKQSYISWIVRGFFQIGWGIRKRNEVFGFSVVSVFLSPNMKANKKLIILPKKPARQNFKERSPGYATKDDLETQKI